MKCRELAAKIGEKKGKKGEKREWKKQKQLVANVFVNLSIAWGQLQAAAIVNSTQGSACKLATHSQICC